MGWMLEPLFLGDSDEVVGGGLEACFDEEELDEADVDACLEAAAFFKGDSNVLLSEFMNACLARLRQDRGVGPPERGPHI